MDWEKLSSQDAQREWDVYALKEDEPNTISGDCYLLDCEDGTFSVVSRYYDEFDADGNDLIIEHGSFDENLSLTAMDYVEHWMINQTDVVSFSNIKEAVNFAKSLYGRDFKIETLDWSKVDRPDLNVFTRRLLKEIKDDFNIDDFSSFSELHDVCDANQILLNVGLTPLEEDRSLCNSVIESFNKMLRERKCSKEDIGIIEEVIAHSDAISFSTKPI